MGRTKPVACVIAVVLACAGPFAGALAQPAKDAPRAAASRTAEKAGKATPQRRSAVTSKKPGTAAKKARPSAGKAKPRKAVAAKKKGSARRPVAATRKKARPTAARSRSAPSSQQVARRPAAPLPPPLAWTLPPLGPERYYPNGIPELRPEFLHPLPGEAPIEQPAAPAMRPGAEPEWLP